MSLTALRLCISFISLSYLLTWIYGECPNACSAHGKCEQFDMCQCYRNWIANDCSQRLCQFGIAHIDIPKGNLDASDGYLSGPDVTVIKNDLIFPLGTTEQYPQMVDSIGNVLQNTAHEYAECSNKGYCNRATGECECFEGYEGSACQMMSCPDYLGEECAGHGICQTADEISALDDDNIYKLWDQDVSMGCVCDSGYFGVACEQLSCKVGFDPIYYDDWGSRRYSNWSYVLHTNSPVASIVGNYSLIFYDSYGEQWRTKPIDANAFCGEITAALEGIPNDVIPHNSIRCVQWRDYNSIDVEEEPISFSPNPYYGIKTTISFPANPGILKQPEFDVYLDGKRPTLTSTVPGAPPKFFIYPNGFHGEVYDYFPDKCIDVDVSILEYIDESSLSDSRTSYHYLGDLTPLESRLLAQCLGDADGTTQTPQNLTGSGKAHGQDYNWDYGTIYNPHLVKFTDLTSPVTAIQTDLCAGNLNSVRDAVNSDERIFCTLFHENIRPPGFIAPLYYDPTDLRFKLLTKPGRDYSSLTTFSVFTTEGYAQMISDEIKVFTSQSQPYDRTIFTTLQNSSSTLISSDYTGNIDCETNTVNMNGALDCLEKGDRTFFVDPSMTKRSMRTNPKYLNLYTVKKIYRQDLERVEVFESELLYNSTGVNRIVLDMSINSAWNIAESDAAKAYVFRPPPMRTNPQLPVSVEMERGQGGFKYVSECSNRGICNNENGICECFAGFTGDGCSNQNNIVA